VYIKLRAVYIYQAVTRKYSEHHRIFKEKHHELKISNSPAVKDNDHSLEIG